MKLIFFTYLLLSSAIYADYFNHPDSKKIIDELVEIHGFKKSYIEEVFKNASFLSLNFLKI